MEWNLKSKFLLPMISLIVVGMGVSTAISYFKARDALKASILEDVNNISNSTSEMMVAWLHDRRLEIKTWSRQDSLKLATQDTLEGKAIRKTDSQWLADVIDLTAAW